MPWNPDDGGEEEGAHQERRRRGGINLSVVFDLDFIKSLAGVLLIIQIVCTFIGLVLASAWRGSYKGGHVFFILIMVATLLAASVILVSRVIRLQELLMRDIPWELIFVCYSASAAVLVLIASCVMVEVAKAATGLKAAGVFGLFVWNSLLVSTIIHAKPYWDNRKQLMSATATAAVSPGAQNAPSNSGDDVQDDFSSEDTTNDQSIPGVILTKSTVRPHSFMEYSTTTQSSNFMAERALRASAVYNPTTETWGPG